MDVNAEETKLRYPYHMVPNPGKTLTTGTISGTGMVKGGLMDRMEEWAKIDIGTVLSSQTYR